MIGAIAVLFVAYRFYRTALRLKLPPLAWAAGGVIVYYAGFAVWLYGVLRPLLGESFRNHTFLLGLGMDLSSVLVGILLATLFRAKIMVKQGGTPYEKHF